MVVLVVVAVVVVYSKTLIAVCNPFLLGMEFSHY
jgi:hypothetical protein